jgi:tRNA nucleotidyltransferase (CCA-adding enzyme)
MRAVRFSAVCGFSIEENTKNAMLRHKDLLKNVSEERKTSEFCKMLTMATSELLLTYKDIFATFIPEIMPSFGFDQQNHHHCYDVYEHTARAVALAPHETVIRLALFFHDIGKPATFTVDENGVGHFYDHAKVSRGIAETVMKRMKFDTATLRLVTELVEAHGLGPSDSQKYARRLLGKFGEEQAKRLITIARCDVGAQAAYEERNSVFLRLDSLEKSMDHILEEKQCFSMKNLAVNGNDIKALGIKEGKEIGRLLSLLLDAVLEDPTKNEKKELLRLANQYKK